jgi:hypothetical protein
MNKRLQFMVDGVSPNRYAPKKSPLGLDIKKKLSMIRKNEQDNYFDSPFNIEKSMQ